MYGGNAEGWESVCQGPEDVQCENKSPERALVVCSVREASVHPVSSDIFKAFFGEVVVWERLRHPNGVPFLGSRRGHCDSCQNGCQMGL